MSTQIFENNDVNGTGTPCESSSPGKCSPAQQRGHGCHPVTARVKWNKEVNKVAMECFYRRKPLMRKENLFGDTDRQCIENEEKGERLNQQSNVSATRQGQLERMAGYQNLNWKQ